MTILTEQLKYPIRLVRRELSYMMFKYRLKNFRCMKIKVEMMKCSRL